MPEITAISSLGWAHYTLYEALPRMAARGFKQVEIASFNSYCFHFNFATPGPDELRRLLSQHELTPIALNWSPGVPFPWATEETRRWVTFFKRKIEEAAAVGISMMTMHFGKRNARVDQQKQLSTAARIYDTVADFAQAYDIKMLLEVPHLYTIHWNTDAVLWLFDNLRSPNIGALVDSSHWGISRYDLDSFLDALGDRLWHIHLRDSAGPDTADCKQDLELTPGRGEVDFGKFGRALDRIGYRGDVTIEFEYRDLPLDSMEREFDAGLRHLVNEGWSLPRGVKY